MATTMDATQLKAMQAGRRRAERERRQESIRRVVEFERWLAAGCRGQLPLGLPTDGDYQAARAAGRTRH